jgi:hypothetical protein
MDFGLMKKMANESPDTQDHAPRARTRERAQDCTHGRRLLASSARAPAWDEIASEKSNTKNSQLSTE